MRHIIFATAIALTAAMPAQAKFRYSDGEDLQSYVESNLLSVFYHELGHALIDIMGLPIFGQEEDAADVLSVFLIDAFWEEESAVQIAYDSAFGFQAEADQYEPIFWDVHGPDLQRYYNLICVFYGANPDEREDVANELGLPEERAEYCDVEYDQANGSWGDVLDKITAENGGNTIRMSRVERDTDGANVTADLMIAEIEALNEEFKLPSQLTVNVEECGEANAWYDPDAKEIVMCSEFADDIADNADL
jgi:hypothetical protein